MKKYLLYISAALPLLVLTILFGNPGNVSAQAPGYDQCYSLLSELRQGPVEQYSQARFEIYRLQQFLYGEGEDVTNYTGFFATSTKNALISWQTKNGINPASGIADAATRQKIRQKSCNVGEPRPIFGSATSGGGFSIPPLLRIGETSYGNQGTTTMYAFTPLAIGAKGGDVYFNIAGAVRVGLYRNGVKVDEQTAFPDEPFGGDVSHFEGSYVVKSENPVARMGVQTVFNPKVANGDIAGTYLAKIESIEWNDGQVTLNPGVTSSQLVISEADATRRPSVKVTSPNGGEVVLRNKPLTITWETKDMKVTDLATVALGVERTAGGITYFCDSCYYLGYQVPNTGSFQWNGEFGGGNAPGYDLVEGQRAKITVFAIDPIKSIRSDQSDNYFSLVTSNTAPTLSLTSGPNTLAVGQTGTWKLAGQDEDGGALTYKADWGDSTTNNSATSTFTHAYSSAKLYAPTFTVTDSTGLSAQITTNVQVGTASNTPVITSMTPTSGPVGTTITLTGSGFGATNYIAFNGLIRDVTRVSTSTLSFKVPLMPNDMYGVSVLNMTNNTHSNTLQFTVKGTPVDIKPTITNTYSSYIIADAGPTAGKVADVSFKFTFNNTSNEDLYIGRKTSNSVVVSTVNGPASASLTDISADPSTRPGDTPSAFVIPAGTSRAIRILGIMDNVNGTTGVKQLAVVGVPYSKNSSLSPLSPLSTQDDAGLRIAITLRGNGTTSPATTTPKITVVSPNGGSPVLQGGTETVKWSAQNLRTNDYIQIDVVSNGSFVYRTDIVPNFNGTSGERSVPLIANVGPSSGLKIPEGQYKITVSAYLTQVSDSSDSYFTISNTPPPVAAKITVTAPVAGTQVPVNGTVSAAWTQTHTSNTVDVVLVRNNIAYHKVYAPAVQGNNSFSFGLTDLELPIATNYQIQICDDTIRDTSGERYCSAPGGYFAITSSVPPTTIPSITASAPVSGQTYNPAYPLKISWNQNYASNAISIKLYGGNDSPRDLGTYPAKKGDNSTSRNIAGLNLPNGTYSIEICDEAIADPQQPPTKPLCGQIRFFNIETPASQPTSATLTLVKGGSANGALGAEGTSCTSTCTLTVPSDKPITISATPTNPTSMFSGWTSGCSGTNRVCSIIASTNTTVTAQFDPAFMVSVTKKGTGRGVVTGGDMNCGSTCATRASLNSSVTLTATPDAGSQFTGWTWSGCSGTGTCTVTSSEAKIRSVSATFDLLPSASIGVPSWLANILSAVFGN